MADISKITLPDGSSYDIKGKVPVTLATTTKAYILGTNTTPSATATGVTAVADTGVYLKNTAGDLNSTSYYVNEAVQLKYNSTTKSLDFIFV